jgi:superfamily II DNA or RNA helicase
VRLAPTRTNQLPTLQLRPHQTPHVYNLAQALRLHGVAKDGSEMGTGKTPSACAVARVLKAKMFVVCPKSVIPTWQRWFKAAGVYGEAYNYEHIRLGKHPACVPVKKNGKVTGFQWRLPADAMVVFDEDHNLKSPTSLNSKLLIGAVDSSAPVLLVGATSFSNPLEMKAIGYALGLHNNVNWFGWCLRNGCRRGFFGGLEFRGGRKHLDNLHAQIFPAKGSRMLKRDIPGFPACDTFVESIAVTDPQHIDKCYEEMSRLAELDEVAMSSTTILTDMLRMRQKVELLKVPSLLEIIEDAVQQNMSVVVFVSYKDTLKEIVSRLPAGLLASVVVGEQETAERAAEIASFQADQNRVCVCTYAAGGAGIDLHDVTGKHPRLALLGPTDNPTLFVQALGRVHRDGALSKSTQKILFAADTVEERVRANIEKKLDRIETLMASDLSPFTQP